jgi:hypothetical protein
LFVVVADRPEAQMGVAPRRLPCHGRFACASWLNIILALAGIALIDVCLRTWLLPVGLPLLLSIP